MKNMSWKTPLVCGLALSLGSLGLFVYHIAVADELAQGGKSGGDKTGSKSKGNGDQGAVKPADGQGRSKEVNSEGGQRSGGQGSAGSGQSGQGRGGQGAGSQNGGNRGGQASPGGNAPRSGGRGGMHVPPSNTGPRQPTGRGGQQPSINRTPSFSRPSVRGNGRVTTPGGSATFRRPTRGPIRTDVVPNSRGDGVSGSIRLGDQGTRVNVGGGTRTRGSDFNRSRITNRPFDGNTVNFNNRRFNVGHNSYQPSYYRHSGYHGYWNGNRGFGGGSGYRYGRGSNYGYGGGYGAGWGWGLGNGYGGYGGGYGGGYAGYGRGYRGYGYRPFGWGLGGWGLGSIIYNSGYLGYSNPYYVDGGWSGYNYSQPIIVTYNTSSVVADNDPNSADEVLSNAVAAFQQNDYDAALDITNKGITQFPDDAVLHEFRSLVLFAKQDYQQSASTIHSVLAVGPGWDWTTLSSMYSSVAIYTEQLRALEAFTKANPEDAASRFLLAYHYMSCGHAEPAARQLRQVVQLMPNDRVAADMLKMVAPPEVTQLDETAPQPEQELTRPDVKPINKASLVGKWKAAREDGSTFGLTLTNDAKFKWSFAQKDQPAQEFEGTYSVEENVLALERSDGGSLIAEVTPGGEAMFNFKLIGAPEDDPGLDFNK